MKLSMVEMLRQVPLFDGLDDRALEELAQHCRLRRFDAHQAVFHQDEPGHLLYMICAGRVNIQTVTANGDPLHLTHRVAGECFGEMALIDNEPRMADAVTAEPCELLTLHRDAFIRCVESSPRVALRVMAVLAARLRQAATQFGSHQDTDVLGRVAQALVERLETGAADAPNGAKRLTAKITQQQLAEEVHSSRETVNRALALLKETNVLRMEGRTIVVANERKLRELCCRS